MGGLALKHLNVRRVSKAEYAEVCNRMVSAFRSLFDQAPSIIPSYRNKPDFGDCDSLIVASALPEDWRTQLANLVESQGFVVNGGVTSIEMYEVQFDFISVPPTVSDHVFAYTYFAYNDLGNLMGRIAHKLGFKYGHLGLQKVLRHGDHVFATLPVANSPAEIFEFLGYSYGRWLKGFSELTDVFEFAASSPYFEKDIFLLDNRNAKSRVRDSKRKTYTDFLKWCDTLPTLVSTREQGTEERHAFQLDRAFAKFPDFKSRYQRAEALRLEHADLKSRWNGENVMEWTGLSGKPLGNLMSAVRADPGFGAASTSLASLKELVLGLAERITK
jgi:hypothetical protein